MKIQKVDLNGGNKRINQMIQYRNRRNLKRKNQNHLKIYKKVKNLLLIILMFTIKEMLIWKNISNLSSQSLAEDILEIHNYSEDMNNWIISMFQEQEFGLLRTLKIGGSVLLQFKQFYNSLKMIFLKDTKMEKQEIYFQL